MHLIDKDWINHCYDHIEDLTDWEAEFIESLIGKIIDDEDPDTPTRYWLTAAQREKLVTIVEKING